MALDQEVKANIVAKFQRAQNDTGSPEVQVALLTQQIKELTEHLKSNKQDHSSRLGLLKMVGKRKRLLTYLKKTDYTRFVALTSELGIRAK